MTPRWDLSPADQARMERHASPADLAPLIQDATRELRRIARLVEWLEELRDRRIEERDNGRWPYPPEPRAVSSPCGRSHVCTSCAPRPDVPGKGCVNCRQTGYDQTPCLACAKATAARTSIGADRDLLLDAARYVISHQFASASALQRNIRVGFAKAGYLLVLLEERGIITGAMSPGSRTVLVSRDRLDETLDAIRREADNETAATR